MKKLIYIFLIIFSSLSFALEIKEGKIFDKYGNSIELKEYKRIVVLDAAAIETIFMIEGEKNIIGIARNPLNTGKNRIWPYDRTEKIPSVGVARLTSFEKIVEMEPDLVILNKGSLKMKENLKKLGIDYFVNDATYNVKDILNTIKIYGVFFNKTENAEKLYNECMAIYKKVREKEEKDPVKLKGAMIYMASPMITLTDKYLPGQVLNEVGVINIAKNPLAGMPTLSPEVLLKEDIDILIVSDNIGTVEDILKVNPTLKKLRVFKEDNIIFAHAIDFFRGSPRVFPEMERLYDKLLEIKNKNKI